MSSRLLRPRRCTTRGGGCTLRELGSVISFLTILPARASGLETVARHAYLFPAMGAAIGVITGSLGFGASQIMDPLVTGLIVAAATAIITGAHHTDGLADFADGMMARGDRGRKLSAMKDLYVGSAGVTAIVLYYIGLVVSLSLEGGYALFIVIILAEVTAKFSMVIAAWVGRPAFAGSGSVFASIIDGKRVAAAAAISIVPAMLLGGAAGLVMLGTGVATAILVSFISARLFGGTTGDVLGAVNELSRLASILAFVSI